MITMPGTYVVQGLTVSYFTRKVTGYLDHARLPWWLDPSIGLNPPARDAGWNGGIPVVLGPDGEPMWDSTAVLLHLDTQVPERSILPDDPTLRFLAFLLDDFSDEWFYRHAVGTRWLHEENVVAGSWDIAREGTVEIGRDIASVRQFVTDAMTGCLPRLGTTPENIGAWVAESLVPWLQTLGRHVDEHGFLLGRRPCLADFAFFGGNAAHFVNDPWCRMLVEDVAPSVIAYTHRMWRPGPDELGPWLRVDEIPDSLVAVLAEAGRHYLPWVAQATVDGMATVKFDDGTSAEIATTPFLTEARGIMLARYVEARSPELDALLERAGILDFYAGHVDRATTIPDPLVRPRPSDNRPYPAGA
jgi:glutathione S-transferase